MCNYSKWPIKIAASSSRKVAWACYVKKWIYTCNMYNSKSLLEVLVSLLKAFVQINNEHYALWYKLSEHQVLTELKKNN